MGRRIKGAQRADRLAVRINFAVDKTEPPFLKILDRLDRFGTTEAIDLKLERRPAVLHRYAVEQVLHGHDVFAGEVHARATNGLENLLRHARLRGSERLRQKLPKVPPTAITRVCRLNGEMASIRRAEPFLTVSLKHYENGGTAYYSTMSHAQHCLLIPVRT